MRQDPQQSGCAALVVGVMFFVIDGYRTQQHVRLAISGMVTKGTVKTVRSQSGGISKIIFAFVDAAEKSGKGADTVGRGTCRTTRNSQGSKPGARPGTASDSVPPPMLFIDGENDQPRPRSLHGLLGQWTRWASLRSVC